MFFSGQFFRSVLSVFTSQRQDFATFDTSVAKLEVENTHKLRGLADIGQKSAG